MRKWLLVSGPHASILVSLVQVATTLPYVLCGLVAGVLADTLYRRLILITVPRCNYPLRHRALADDE